MYDPQASSGSGWGGTAGAQRTGLCTHYTASRTLDNKTRMKFTLTQISKPGASKNSITDLKASATGTCRTQHKRLPDTGLCGHSGRGPSCKSRECGPNTAENTCSATRKAGLRRWASHPPMSRASGSRTVHVVLGGKVEGGQTQSAAEVWKAPGCERQALFQLQLKSGPFPVTCGHFLTGEWRSAKDTDVSILQGPRATVKLRS